MVTNQSFTILGEERKSMNVYQRTQVCCLLWSYHHLDQSEHCLHLPDLHQRLISRSHQVDLTTATYYSQALQQNIASLAYDVYLQSFYTEVETNENKTPDYTLVMNLAKLDDLTTKPVVPLGEVFSSAIRRWIESYYDPYHRLRLAWDQTRSVNMTPAKYTSYVLGRFISIAPQTKFHSVHEHNKWLETVKTTQASRDLTLISNTVIRII